MPHVLGETHSWSTLIHQMFLVKLTHYTLQLFHSTEGLLKLLFRITPIPLLGQSKEIHPEYETFFRVGLQQEAGEGRNIAGRRTSFFFSFFSLFNL